MLKEGGKTGAKCVAMVGMFPPPTSGAAKNNQILLEDLGSDGVIVTKLATSGEGLAHKRGLHYHAERLLTNIGVLSRILNLNRPLNSFYIVPDAGLGMLYSAIHIFFGRGKAGKLFIHHRSFKYIDTVSPFMRLIVRLTRGRAIHVFLSESMGSKFEAVYGDVAKRVVSNAHYVLPNISLARDRTQRAGLVVGHLSNLCRDKGFYEVVAVFERLAPSQGDVELRLAGPPIDADVEATIKRLQAEWPGRVSHLGAVYGQDKVRFYEELDVFLFPTKHPQEAQPNVIYEALAAGVAVMATPRGTIPEMLDGNLGAVSPDEPSFVDWCVGSIRQVAERRDRAEIKESLRLEAEAALAEYEKLKRAIAE